MSPLTEKRLLQAAIVAGGAFSILFAASSVVRGVDVLVSGAPDLELDSHFRYLSGIFLGLLLALYSCVPRIERHGARFRLMGALIICGGLARLLGLVTLGVPGNGHLYGLAMELIVTPTLLLWQRRVARRCGASTASAAA